MFVKFETFVVVVFAVWSTFSAKAADARAVGGVRDRSDLDTFRGSGPGPVDAVPGPAIEHSAGVNDFKPVSNKMTSFAKVGLKVLKVWPQGRLSRDIRRRRQAHSVCG